MVLHTLKVLVADDEILVAESVEGMLEDLGHTVVGLASNGGQMVGLAVEKQSDVKFSHGICPDCVTELYTEYQNLF